MTTAITAASLEFEEVLHSLQKHEENTEFEAQDLTTAVVEKDSEYGSLTFGSRRYELNIHSARQLCKMGSISWGFYQKASSELIKSTFKEFLPAMKDPQKKLAIKLYGKKTVLRGILPVDYPDIRNSQVLEAVSTITVPFEVESAPWLDKNDDPIMRTRFVFPSLSGDVKGDKLKIGLDVLASELGGCQLEANIILYREVCTNGAIATYGKKPYFYFDYKSASVPNLDLIFKMSIQRAGSDCTVLLQKVEKAVNTPVSAAEAISLFDKLHKSNFLNKGVALQAIACIEKDGCTNMWEAINALTAAARGYRDLLRLRYERAAGGLIGMDFDRNQDESDFATTSNVLSLPPSIIVN